MSSSFINFKYSKIVSYTTIVSLVFLIYGSSLQFSYNIDDEYYLKMLPDENSSLSEKIASINQPFNEDEFRPVSYSSFLLEGSLFKRSPKTFHFFNLLYYSLLCCSILFVFDKIFQIAKLKNAFWIALLASLFFLVHPSHANIVASIKNRESIIGLFLALWSMYFWINYLLEKRTIKWIFFLSSILLLVAAILAKRDTFTFLLIIPAATYMLRLKTSFYKYTALSVLFFLLVMILQSIIFTFPEINPDHASIVTLMKTLLTFQLELQEDGIILFILPVCMKSS